MNMKSHVAILLKDKEKILFIQRSEAKRTLPNVWAVPSGTVEEGETLEETTRREAMEELGVSVEVHGVMTEVEVPEFDTKLHFVICSIRGGFPGIKEPDEIRSLRWMTFGEFFEEYDDTRIGHGLIRLRKRPEIWGSHVVTTASERGSHL